MMNGHHAPNNNPQPIPLFQLPLMGTPPFIHQQNHRRQGGYHPPSIQRMMSADIARGYSGETSGSSGVGSNTSTNSGNGGPHKGSYFNQRKHPKVSDKHVCVVCNELYPVEQLTQVACGHRLCIQCLSIPPSNGGLIQQQQFDRCPVCTPTMYIFSGNNLRDAFNSETSSPIFGVSAPLASASVKLNSFDNYNIWEPLPLTTQERSNSFGRGEVDVTRPPTGILNPSGSFPNIHQAQIRRNNNSSRNSLATQKPIQLQYGNNSEMKTQKCTSCDERSSVIAHCLDCSEFLCAACVLAHARVKLTKEHKIQMIRETVVNVNTSSRSHSDSASIKADSESPNSCTGNSITSLTSCPDHDLAFVAVCSTCGGPNLCVRCLQLHSGHQLKVLPISENQSQVALKRLVMDSKNVQRSMEDALEGVKRMVERVEASVQAVVGEMRSVIHLHISTLEERKRDLLQRIDRIHQSKILALKQQNEKILEKMSALERGVAFSEQLCLENSGSEQDYLDCYENLLKLHSEHFVPLVPTANDSIKLKSCNPDLLTELKLLGQVDSGLDPKTTFLIGTRFKRAISGRPYVVNIQMRDVNGDPVSKESREQGGEFIATLYGPLSGGQATLQHAEIVDREGGVCSLMFTPKKVGPYKLNISYCQVPINGCPTEVTVCSGRDYKDAQQLGQKFSFGKEGSGDGEFSRPWGICCDLKGRILVADRSNHRIQIFDTRGNFLSKFGERGSRHGEFNRPAGICVNPSNHIIVADKDNHRIQVFYDDGRFSHTFGSRGCSQGSFNYPWGVATNNNYEIAVTDTRNHRIQIFTASGTLQRICTIDVGVKRSPSSPRGICFLPENELVVSDFNTHRLAVVNAQGESRFFGLEGTAPGFFHRPQGIAIDPDGLVLVCDSRSNRIQVLNLYDLTVVAVFGNDVKYPKTDPTELVTEKMTETSLFRQVQSDDLTPPEGSTKPSGVNLLEHPMDVAISPDGLVYVVDFGNNCIRVY